VDAASRPADPPSPPRPTARFTARHAMSLSQKSATVAVFSPFSGTVALFCDSVDRAQLAVHFRLLYIRVA